MKLIIVFIVFMMYFGVDACISLEKIEESDFEVFEWVDELKTKKSLRG